MYTYTQNITFKTQIIKRSDANLKQKRNFGIQEFEVQHLYVLQTSGQVNMHHERGKKLTAYGTQGGRNDASFIYQTRKL